MSTQKTPTSVSAALNEAQTIIASAEQRAAELRSTAERVYDESKQSGYAAGFEQGRQDAAVQAVRFVQEGAQIGQQLSAEAARLAIAICSTVIGEHVKSDPNLVKKIAERALQQSIVGDGITILAHPDDAATLNSAKDSFRRLAGGASVNIETDPRIVRGGCIVRTEFGEVDASIPVLLESMAAQLGIAIK